MAQCPATASGRRRTSSGSGAGSTAAAGPKAPARRRAGVVGRRQETERALVPHLREGRCCSGRIQLLAEAQLPCSQGFREKTCSQLVTPPPWRRQKRHPWACNAVGAKATVTGTTVSAKGSRTGKESLRQPQSQPACPLLPLF